MSVSSVDVQRIARLAAVHVDEGSLPELARQLARILEYVSQLDAVDAVNTGEAFRPGPERCPRREDVVRPSTLAWGPDTFAPATVDGLFVVPKLGAMEIE